MRTDGGDAIEVRYEVDEAHELAQQKAAQARMQRQHAALARFSRVTNAALTLSVAMALFTLYKLAQTPAAADLGWALLGMAPLAALVVLVMYQQKTAWKLYVAGSGPHPYVETLGVDGDSLTVANPRGRSVIPLSRVVEVEERTDAVVVHLRAGVAILVPNRAFVEPTERARFVEQARRGANSPAA